MNLGVAFAPLVPDYVVWAAFGVADYARPNQRIFPVVDAFKGTWSVGLTLNWTLNDALVASTNQHRIEAETNELRADADGRERQAISARMLLAREQLADDDVAPLGSPSLPALDLEPRQIGDGHVERRPLIQCRHESDTDLREVIGPKTDHG